MVVVVVAIPRVVRPRVVALHLVVVVALVVVTVVVVVVRVVAACVVVLAAAARPEAVHAVACVAAPRSLWNRTGTGLSNFLTPHICALWLSCAVS